MGRERAWKSFLTFTTVGKFLLTREPGGEFFDREGIKARISLFLTVFYLFCLLYLYLRDGGDSRPTRWQELATEAESGLELMIVNMAQYGASAFHEISNLLKEKGFAVLYFRVKSEKQQ